MVDTRTEIRSTKFHAKLLVESAPLATDKGGKDAKTVHSLDCELSAGVAAK